ncbi:hypothetical protein CENSYa_1890 [Cenarchaeum symbiosum A]|uniref:Uncharacterized protein n=1 Tax=Cenarchaeum symbiosum (strain A) TaxID=414004 RepID=A0RYT2_CENSY|nr:hypothetical protein CENSYa_1890 [Cenarchaeum symbiosum A]
MPCPRPILSSTSPRVTGIRRISPCRQGLSCPLQAAAKSQNLHKGHTHVPIASPTQLVRKIRVWMLCVHHRGIIPFVIQALSPGRTLPNIISFSSRFSAVNWASFTAQRASSAWPARTPLNCSACPFMASSKPSIWVNSLANSSRNVLLSEAMVAVCDHIVWIFWSGAVKSMRRVNTHRSRRWPGNYRFMGMVVGTQEVFNQIMKDLSTYKRYDTEIKINTNRRFLLAG